jgi:hypothetical protein
MSRSPNESDLASSSFEIRIEERCVPFRRLPTEKARAELDDSS